MTLGRALLWTGGILTIAAAGTVSAFAWWFAKLEDPLAILPPANVTYRNTPNTGALGAPGIIEIDGLLTPATATLVETMMRNPPGPIRTLRIRSNGGGGNGAERLATLANTKRLTVQVPDKAICSSACVIFLAAIAKDQLQIAPGAWLRVHGRSTGPNDPIDRQPSTLMDAAVQTLSPPWYAFLQACPSKPLVRDAGIAMTWAEIRSLERQPTTLDCTRIAHRTKDWLFSATPRP